MATLSHFHSPRQRTHSGKRGYVHHKVLLAFREHQPRFTREHRYDAISTRFFFLETRLTLT